jgi:hypothetical protein
MDRREELLHELALDILDKAKFPYVLIVGDGPTTKVDSHMTPEDREKLLRWIEEGRWNDLLKEHFDQNKS